MKFVTVSCEYIDYIRGFCNTIQHNKDGTRPYVGILLKIGEHDYYAPFGSPKPKHVNMKSSLDFIKIDNGNLGVINLNNMIPIPLSETKIILFENIVDLKYKNLIEKQYLWAKDNEELIMSRTQKLYSIIKTKENTVFHSRCTDFGLVEEKKCEYLKEKQIDPWEKQLKGFKNNEKKIDLK